MEAFRKAKVWALANPVAAGLWATAALILFLSLAYAGKSEAAEEPFGYKSATVSFCQTSRVVKALWSAGSPEAADALFEASPCIFTGTPVTAIIIKIGETFTSNITHEQLTIVEIAIPGFKEKAFWVVDQEIAGKARAMLGGL